MKRKLEFAVSCALALILFCLNEYCLSFSSNPEKYIILREFLKFGISFLPFMLSLISWQRKKNPQTFWFMIGFLLCLIGDVSINIELSLGAAIYIFGHLSFIKAFLTYKKPSKIQIIAWFLACASLIVAILLVSSKNNAIKTFTIAVGIIYSIFMTAMVAFSFCAPKQICVGGILFNISDILLMLNIVYGQTPLSHMISLGTYYLGVMIMIEKIHKTAAATDSTKTTDKPE